MEVKSIIATDYSTGTQYTYSGTSGTWDSIQAVGGKVNSGGGKGVATVGVAPPTVTAASNSAPMPFQGTHRDTTSTFVTPDIYPWVPTTLQKSPVATVTTYPGLPSGWTVTDDGKVLPPSAAPVSERPSYPWAFGHLLQTRTNVQTWQSTSLPPLPTSSQSVSPQDSPLGVAGGGLETITTFDEKGFLTTITRAVAAATGAKQYNEQGFLVTNPSEPTSTGTSPTKVLALADSTDPSMKATKVPPTNAAANPRRFDRIFGAVCGLFLCGAFIL